MSASADPFDARSPFVMLEYARRKRLLLAISNRLQLALLPVVLVFGLALYLQPVWQVAVTFSMTAVMIPASWLAHFLARRDRVETSGYLLLIYFLLVVTGNGLLIEGLFGGVAPTFTVLVIIAGMVLGPSGSYVIALIGIGLWTSSLALQGSGLVPQAPAPPGTTTALLISIVSIGLLFTAFISQLATRDLRRALNDATYELVQVNRKLEDASQMKSQFMARTSHELRTPLNAIIGFTDLVLRGVYGPLTDLQEGGLRRVLSNARRLLTLINDILDLAKIEAGELEITEYAFDLSNLVELAETTLAPRANQKGLTLNITVAPDMPRQIVGDETRISQVVLNLVDNAVKYTDAGSVELQLDAPDPGHWRIRVIDTGRGVHERDYERIFEEFRQLDASGDQKGGTGLGLTITRHLVRLMGGEIRLTSTLGKGSTFEVTLPLKAPVAAVAQPA